MEPKKLQPITALPRAIAALTHGRTCSYRAGWVACVDGTIPAQQVNGRWYYDPVDLPQIARALGLTPAVATAA